jgi:hypothetical protein
MRRIAWRILVFSSFVLCIATLALWMRSYSHSDAFDRWRRDVGGPGTYHDTTGVFSSRGAVGTGRLRIYLPTTQDWPADPRWRFNSQPARAVSWEHRWWFLGFGYWNVRYPAGPAHRGLHPVGVTVPHWFIATLFAIPPTIWARRGWRERRKRKRVERGLCAACGYDVRANPERCPECGGPVPSPRTQGEGQGESLTAIA